MRKRHSSISSLVRSTSPQAPKTKSIVCRNLMASEAKVYPPHDSVSEPLNEADPLRPSRADDPPATQAGPLPSTGDPKVAFGDLKNYWKHYDNSSKERTDEMIGGFKDNLQNIVSFVFLYQ